MKYNLIVQLGSQVMYSAQKTGAPSGGYSLAPHTEMRTKASAYAMRSGLTERLMIAGGSNFGVRYDDEKIFGVEHPTQKKPSFTFEAFSASDFNRKSESAVIKHMLVYIYGLNPDKIFAETLSATTEENAEFIKIILRRRPMFTGKEKIGILTLLYHMERALPIFRMAGLNVEPVFAENILASNDECGKDQVNQICDYYSTPKSGKQYSVDKIRQLLTEDKSLAELM